MTISAANLAELNSEHSRRVYFIFLDFAHEAFRACTAQKTLQFDSEDWLGIGEISGISDIAHAADIAARPITITATGVDAYITEPVHSRTNYKGQQATVYRGFLDEDGDLVDDPYILWTGRMDVGAMLRDEQFIAQITCEPLSARLLRPNTSRYSDEDHQLRHAGDKFYEFLPQMEKKDVTWGGKNVAPAQGYGPGAGFGFGGIGPLGPLTWRRP